MSRLDQGGTHPQNTAQHSVTSRCGTESSKPEPLLPSWVVKKASKTWARESCCKLAHDNQLAPEEQTLLRNARQKSTTGLPRSVSLATGQLKVPRYFKTRRWRHGISNWLRTAAIYPAAGILPMRNGRVDDAMGFASSNYAFYIHIWYQAVFNKTFHASYPAYAQNIWLGLCQASRKEQPSLPRCVP